MDDRPLDTLDTLAKSGLLVSHRRTSSRVIIGELIDQSLDPARARAGRTLIEENLAHGPVGG